MMSTCECGCGLSREKYDKRGRERRFINGHSSRKNGRSINGYGYVRILYGKSHPRANNGGYVFEHILVMEKHLGRHLYPQEVVHHVNHNVQDNRIENLRILTKSEHATLHRIGTLDYSTKDISETHIRYWRKSLEWLFEDEYEKNNRWKNQKLEYPMLNQKSLSVYPVRGILMISKKR